MSIVSSHIVQTQSLVHYLVHIVQTPKNHLEKNSADPPQGTITSGRNAQNQHLGPLPTTPNACLLQHTRISLVESLAENRTKKRSL